MTNDGEENLSNIHGRDDRAPLVRAPFFHPFEEIEEHWHNVPHWQQGEVWQFVTWRLADSLPMAKLNEWNHEKALWVKKHPRPWDEETARAHHERFSKRIDAWLDAGHGSCVLKHTDCGAIVANTMRYFAGLRYKLNDFVVMPNHVHVLFRPVAGHALEDILHSWKSFSAKEINKVIKRRGVVWQEDYWDRMIRNEAHLRACRNYIANNPIAAKLSPNQYILHRESET